MGKKKASFISPGYTPRTAIRQSEVGFLITTELPDWVRVELQRPIFRVWGLYVTFQKDFATICRSHIISLDGEVVMVACEFVPLAVCYSTPRFEEFRSKLRLCPGSTAAQTVSGTQLNQV